MSKDRDIAAVNIIVICRENWVRIKIKSAKLLPIPLKTTYDITYIYNSFVTVHITRFRHHQHQLGRGLQGLHQRLAEGRGTGGACARGDPPPGQVRLGRHRGDAGRGRVRQVTGEITPLIGQFSIVWIMIGQLTCDM